MTEKVKPARLGDFAKATSSEPAIVETKETKLPADVEFQLPKFELDLGFFISKGNEPFTEESLIAKVFGEEGKRLSQPEQIYVLLNAMQDLEVVAPLNFECEHCGHENPIAVELAKVMKTSSSSKERFFIEYTGKDGKYYIFEFVRPEIIQDVGHIDSPTASIGMFMLQWLDAHNQGDDFDILKMRLVDFLAVAKLFGEKMFGVLFETKFKCAKCKKQNTQEFGISLKDLVDILNEI
nr:MAG TPA: baseplate protein [Caudoviricetes sp.]